MQHDFNSIKVRLKPSNYRSEIEDALFQFHKGTIKTKDRYTISSTSFQFQFHKGTIKT